MTTAVRVTDDADRATLVSAVVQLRAKQCRLPVHFEAERLKVAREVDRLVARIVAMDRAGL